MLRANRTLTILGYSLLLGLLGNTAFGQDKSAIQINLDNKGQLLTEGLKGNKNGQYGPPVKQYNKEPHEVGDQVQVIRIYEYKGPDSGPSELVNEKGESTHAHSGPTNPPYNGHCHQWVKIGPTWYLVHCQP